MTEAQGFGTRTDERSKLRAEPNITSLMRFGSDQRDLRKRYTVQDLTCFGPLVDVLRTSLAGLAATSYRDWRREKVARWRKDVRWSTDGALNHSLGFLLMCHDNSDGELVLDVSDGSVLPRALAVNPLLTISMLAERMADHLRAELKLPAYDPAAERDDR